MQLWNHHILQCVQAQLTCIAVCLGLLCYMRYSASADTALVSVRHDIPCLMVLWFSELILACLQLLPADMMLCSTIECVMFTPICLHNVLKHALPAEASQLLHPSEQLLTNASDSLQPLICKQHTHTRCSGLCEMQLATECLPVHRTGSSMAWRVSWWLSLEAWSPYWPYFTTSPPQTAPAHSSRYASCVLLW